MTDMSEFEVVEITATEVKVDCIAHGVEITFDKCTGLMLSGLELAERMDRNGWDLAEWAFNAVINDTRHFKVSPPVQQCKYCDCLPCDCHSQLQQVMEEQQQLEEQQQDVPFYPWGEE